MGDRKPTAATLSRNISVASRSEEGVRYDVIVYAVAGAPWRVGYCSCEGYQYRKECWHKTMIDLLQIIEAG